MEEKLLKRSEVPVELTWDLSRIFKNTEELEAAAKKASELTDLMEKTYKGNLKTAETINECLDLLREFIVCADHVLNYTYLSLTQDYADSKNNELNAKYSMIFDELNSRLQFIDNEILSADDSEIKNAMDKSNENRAYLAETLRNKPYTLSLELEEALVRLGSTLENPYTVYLSAKNADMNFGTFCVNGKTYPLGYSLFEDDYEYNADTEVRREAFKCFYKKLSEYKNVTAAAYNANVVKEKTLASLRGFDSVFDFLLFRQQVTKESYNRQLDLIMENLAPHMRKFAGLIKKLHKLEKMTYADLKVPVDPGYDPEVTLDRAKEYIRNGLSVMGDEYIATCMRAFDERWIDFAKNQGKETGGFCASPYRKGSYILLSWNNRMSDLMTVAHELGHANHFNLCDRAQSAFDTRVSNYFVEAPSTINELILSYQLLENCEDIRMRRYILAGMISNTYYHNFVTHFLEAYYQREVYKIIDRGESVTAETLSDIFKNTLTKFWGDAVELPEGSELTWMRQPHYYMGLYSYTYSAGLSIATEVCRRIREEGAPAVEDWKNALRAGSTKNPLELAALAGVDMTSKEPFINTISEIGRIIDEIISLSEEIDK